jgi:hypothetical protein
MKITQILVIRERRRPASEIVEVHTPAFDKPHEPASTKIENDNVEEPKEHAATATPTAARTATPAP